MSPLTIAVQWLGFLGTAAALGAAVLDVVIRDPGAGQGLRRLGRAALVLLALSWFAALLLRTETLVGGDARRVLAALPIVLAQTHFGRLWSLRLVAIAVAVAAWCVASRGASGVSLVAMLVVAATTSLTGHADDAGDASLAVAVDWVHVVAASVWTGGLFALATAVLGDARLRAPATLGRIARRFSRLAALALAVVVVTGGYAVWQQMPALDAFRTTGYGRALAAKLAVVAVLVAVATLTRYGVLPRLAPDARRGPGHRAFRVARLVLAGPRGRRGAGPSRFRRWVGGEALLAVLVFACTAILTEATPARHALHAGHGTISEPAGPMYVNMEALHEAGGVPPGWILRPPPGDATRGRVLFARLECYRCHAVAGEGFPAPSGAGPELTEMGRHHPAAYLLESILNPDGVVVEGPGYTDSRGRSTMPDYRDSLSVADLVDLVAYLQTLR